MAGPPSASTLSSGRRSPPHPNILPSSSSLFYVQAMNRKESNRCRDETPSFFSTRSRGSSQISQLSRTPTGSSHLSQVSRIPTGETFTHNLLGDFSYGAAIEQQDNRKDKGRLMVPEPDKEDKEEEVEMKNLGNTVRKLNPFAKKASKEALSFIFQEQEVEPILPRQPSKPSPNQPSMEPPSPNISTEPQPQIYGYGRPIVPTISVTTEAGKSSAATGTHASGDTTLVNPPPPPPPPVKTYSLYPRPLPHGMLYKEYIPYKILHAQILHLTEQLSFNSHTADIASGFGRVVMVTAMQHCILDTSYAIQEATRLVRCFEGLFKINEQTLLDQDPVSATLNAAEFAESYPIRVYEDSATRALWIDTIHTFSKAFSKVMSGKGNPHECVRAMDLFGKHLAYIRAMVPDTDLLYWPEEGEDEKKKKRQLWYKKSDGAKRDYLLSLDSNHARQMAEAKSQEAQKQVKLQDFLAANPPVDQALLNSLEARERKQKLTKSRSMLSLKLGGGRDADSTETSERPKTPITIKSMWGRGTVNEKENDCISKGQTSRKPLPEGWRGKISAFTKIGSSKEKLGGDGETETEKEKDAHEEDGKSTKVSAAHS